jgi:hypothetical protein
VEKINALEEKWGNTPLHQRLQKCIAWWEKNATPATFQLIREGIQPPWKYPPKMSTHPKTRGGQDLQQVEKIMQDYENSGSVKKVWDNSTQHLIPWFLISKTDGQEKKWRLISDCRELNVKFQTKSFKLDHLQQIFPVLQKGHWAANIDLKDAYFHIPVSQALRPFLRHQIGNQTWEFQAGCFGQNIMPQIFM